MTPFQIATSYVGLKEVAGPDDNPLIMAMYSRVGHDWVEHDETAWCAAFVGSCLEEAGIRSTRALNARSYLDWGIPIEAADAQQGDVGVIPRGKSNWQGHVFFVDKIEGGYVYGLGGNQSDAVNIKRFPVGKLLGVRRAAGVGSNPMPGVADVQRRLRALGYHEVGKADGQIGGRTRGAILAFRADNGLRLTPDIDRELAEALATAEPRAIDPARAEGHPEGSRIVAASDRQVVLGAGGAIAMAIPAIEQAEEGGILARRVLDLVGFGDQLSAVLPWVGIAIFIGVIVMAIRAKRARIEDYRSGRTP